MTGHTPFDEIRRTPKPVTDADTVRDGLLAYFNLTGLGAEALAALDRLEAERDELDASLEQAVGMANDQAAAVIVAEDERDRLRELLKRIRQWDHLDGAADGPYWRREIDKIIGDGQ